MFTNAIAEVQVHAVQQKDLSSRDRDSLQIRDIAADELDLTFVCKRSYC